MTAPWQQHAASPQHGTHLNWLLNQFCTENRDVIHVIATASDGIPLAASDGVGIDVRDQLCASTSGLIGLALGMAAFMQAGAPRDIVVGYDEGWVVVQRPSERVMLTALTRPDADLERVHHEMVRLGESIGRVLDPGARVAA